MALHRAAGDAVAAELAQAVVGSVAIYFIAAYARLAWAEGAFDA